MQAVTCDCAHFAKAQARLQPDGAVSVALDMLRSWPVPPLRKLAAKLGLSHKQMLARFDSRVGVTPKLASRIFRFQRALVAINETKTVPDWADLALDCGYYDQPHLIHEFQQLAGLTRGLLTGPHGVPSVRCSRLKGISYNTDFSE